MGHRLGLCESESLVIGICDRLRRSGQGQLRGKWAVGSGQWAVGSGQWAVGSRQWAVGSGQWAVGPASPELARATVGRN